MLEQFCDQCSYDIINGVACHETGCPNHNILTGGLPYRWQTPRECHGCGVTFTPILHTRWCPDCCTLLQSKKITMPPLGGFFYCPWVNCAVYTMPILSSLPVWALMSELTRTPLVPTQPDNTTVRIITSKGFITNKGFSTSKVFIRVFPIIRVNKTKGIFRTIRIIDIVVTIL